ncbi:hypothetical protein WHW08_28350 [Klebsiella pneumoniae]
MKTPTGVCHTDALTRFPVMIRKVCSWWCSAMKVPGVVVVEVGEGVTSVKPGDHVIPLRTAECGECGFLYLR